MRHLTFRRTTVLTVLFSGFLAGLGLARVGYELGWSWLFLASVLLIITFRKQNLTSILAAVLFGVVAGIMRGDAFMDQTNYYEAHYGQEVVVEAQVVTPAVYADNGQLEFDVSDVRILEPEEIALPGRLQVQGYRLGSVYRGDTVHISGKIFPGGGSRQGKISYSDIDIIQRSGSVVEKTRREFVAGIQTALPEPSASFGLGLLVGQRNTLPDDVTRQLSVVGLTHIIAVSGYNLTIIVRGVRRLLGKWSKYQSTVISLALVGAFLLVTGFSASIVRAAIVSLLSIWAWYYGRTIKPLLLISLAAAITAGWNPIYIWSDIGWYLSFLAFFGVLIIAPLLKQKLFGDKPQKFIDQVMLESVSAQLMAAPLIMFIFSEVSLIALISNMIVVPLVPFAMVFSVIAGLAGMFVPTISGILAWPGTALMTFMLDIVNLFSRIPNALVERALPLSSMVLVYGLIIFLTLIVQRQLRAKYGIITDKNIVE